MATNIRTGNDVLFSNGQWMDSITGQPVESTDVSFDIQEAPPGYQDIQPVQAPVVPLKYADAAPMTAGKVEYTEPPQAVQSASPFSPRLSAGGQAGVGVSMPFDPGALSGAIGTMQGVASRARQELGNLPSSQDLTGQDETSRYAPISTTGSDVTGMYQHGTDVLDAQGNVVQLAEGNVALSGGVNREELLKQRELIANNPKLKTNLFATQRLQEIDSALAADTGQRQAAEEAAYKAQQNLTLQEQNKAMQAERDTFQTKISSETNKLNSLLDDIAKTKIDPGKKIRENFGWVILVTLTQAIAQALYARDPNRVAGQAPQNPANLIENIIERDIQQQQMSLESKKTAAQVQSTKLGQMRQIFGDKIQGMEAAKMQMREAFISKLDELKTKWEGDAKGDAANLLQDQLRQKQSESMLKFREAAESKLTDAAYKSGQLAATREELRLRTAGMLTKAPKEQKPIPAQLASDFGDAVSIVGDLDKLEQIAQAAIKGQVGGAIKQYFPNLASDKAAPEDQLNNIIRNVKLKIARASGEKGPLSDTDLKVAGDRLPGNWNTWVNAKDKVDQLRSVLGNSIVNRLGAVNDLYDIGDTLRTAGNNIYQRLHTASTQQPKTR